MDDDDNDGENTFQGHTCWQQESKLCSQDRDLLGRAGNHFHDYYADDHADGHVGKHGGDHDNDDEVDDNDNLDSEGHDLLSQAEDDHHDNR